MNDKEKSSHILIKRLNYLLGRLEKEFFHIHPSIEENGKSTSLALTSILNEAVILHEAPFGANNFWYEILKWGSEKDWKWEEVEIRFTYWPELSILKPFSMNPSGQLEIVGREENNLSKHNGKLGTLNAAINACSAAWFIIMEVARESEIFLTSNESEEIMKLFDCYELIGISSASLGLMVSRPLATQVEYPSVRGMSEAITAKEAFNSRYKKWKLKKNQLTD